MNDPSDHFKQMAASSERFGVLENPDGYGVKKGDCGDIIEMYLSVKAGRVSMLTFQIAGCLNTYVCSNTVSYFAEGRMVKDCWEIGPEHVIDYLESLPEDHYHCAELAIGTFYLALNDYNKKRKETWQNVYPQKRVLDTP
jgi:nitrogen fixation protein NifU and related proteins